MNPHCVKNNRFCTLNFRKTADRTRRRLKLNSSLVPQQMTYAFPTLVLDYVPYLSLHAVLKYVRIYEVYK